MTFLKDRIAVADGIFGACLATLTLFWRINPVEVSVMPAFLTGTTLGK